MNKVLILVIFAAIGIIEIPGLVKKKYWKELIAFLLLLGLGLILVILVWFRVRIPFLMPY